MKRTSRREFLGAAGLAAGAFLARPTLVRAAAAPSSRVAIGICPQYNAQVMATLSSMFDQLGGLEKLVKNKTVAIKLNFTGGPTEKQNGLPVELTHWSNPTVIGATLALMDKAGAKRIRLLESHFVGDMPLADFMVTAGWKVQDLISAARRVEFENTNYLAGHKEYARFMVPGSPRMYAGFDLNPSYRDNDVMVSMARLKEHRITGITFSMKNMFGSLPTTIYGATAPVDEPSRTVVPGPRAAMCHFGKRVPPKSAPPAIDITSHEPGYRMPRIVPELVAARPIDLAIIDGIYSLEGGEMPIPNKAGTEQGTRQSADKNQAPGFLTNLVHPGILIAGLNPVCTDAVATAVMGWDTMALRGQPPFETADNMLQYAEELGIGSRDLKNIEVVGASIARVRYPYHSVQQSAPA